MSQHDLNIANQGFPAFRADLNDALVALGSTNSGATAPATTFANQLWYDTANNILKIRNEDNDAWISIATLDQSGDVLSLIALNTISEGTSGSGVTVDGVLLKDNAVTASADSTISGLTVGKGGGAVSSNTVVGNGALNANTTGLQNVAVGANALNANTTGQGSVAVGSGALQSNTTANNNTAVGINSLLFTTTGQYNSAYGTASLQSNTTGANNVAHGYGALQNNTIASDNTAVGYQAGYANTTGTRNAFFGHGAGSGNTTGSYNTGIGSQVFTATLTGSENTSVGYGSSYAMTSGTFNTAVGRSALFSTTTGIQNTAIGNDAGYSITTASDNTVIGFKAGTSLTTGAVNTFIGSNAGKAVTTTAGNVAIGQDALQACITGSGNTIIGREAGYYVTGGGNVVVGSQTSTSTYSPAFDITSQSNYISMGSSNVTNAYIKVAWTVTSDARDKTNIVPVPHGLDFVSKLNPVQYQFVDNRQNMNPVGDKLFGFLAQEILALEGDNPVIIDNVEEEHLRYKGESLVPVLVKAIQELKAEFDAYKATHP